MNFVPPVRTRRGAPLRSATRYGVPWREMLGILAMTMPIAKRQTARGTSRVADLLADAGRELYGSEWQAGLCRGLKVDRRELRTLAGRQPGQPGVSPGADAARPPPGQARLGRRQTNP